MTKVIEAKSDAVNEVKSSAKATPDEILSIVEEIPKTEIVETILEQNELEHLPDALFENWNESTKNIVESSESLPDISKVNLKNVDTLTMFLWDVWEDHYRKPGHVFLFGKAEINGVLTSTCVQITNVEHCLYLLPRKKVNG